jgi:hypothetical protein
LCPTSVVTEPALGRRFSRWVGGGVLIIALVGLTAGYITLLRAPAAGTFHDDGIYLVTAKALAEDQGYRIVSLPGEPPQTKYPILFPWLLSLVWRLDPSFPANLPWLRLVPLLATLAWLCLSWPLLRRLGASTAQASAIVLLTAISPWVAFLSTALMSETVFALFLTAGLLMITRACQENGRRIDPFIAGFLFGAAALTRIAGIAPAAAAVAVFLGARRWLSAVQCLFGSAVVIVPWFWWVSGQPTAAVDAYYSAANYASWNIVTSYTWPEKVSVLVRNAGFASLAFTEIWGLRVPYAVPSLLVAVTALTIMCCGLWRTRREPVAIAMLAYCAIHAAWVWPPLRFAVPVTPLMLWFAFQGAGKPRRFGWAAAMVLFVAGGLQLCATVAQAREKGVVYPVSNAENWDDTERLLKWISRETPADATLTGHLDAMYYLFTGRKAARAFSTDPYLLFYDAGRRSENPLGTVDDFRSRLLTMKADYVIVTAPSRSGEVAHLRQLVDELAKRCPGSLSLAAGNVGSGYAIYKTDRLVLERPETCAKHEGLVQGDFWSYGRGVDGGGQSRP